MTDCGAEIGIALADAQQGRGLEKKLMQALIHKAEEKQLAELMLYHMYIKDIHVYRWVLRDRSHCNASLSRRAKAERGCAFDEVSLALPYAPHTLVS